MIYLIHVTQHKKQTHNSELDFPDGEPQGLTPKFPISDLIPHMSYLFTSDVNYSWNSTSHFHSHISHQIFMKLALALSFTGLTSHMRAIRSRTFIDTFDNKYSHCQWHTWHQISMSFDPALLWIHLMTDIHQAFGLGSVRSYVISHLV